jgi:hypothetical protein
LSSFLTECLLTTEFVLTEFLCIIFWNSKMNARDQKWVATQKRPAWVTKVKQLSTHVKGCWHKSRLFVYHSKSLLLLLFLGKYYNIFEGNVLGYRKNVCLEDYSSTLTSIRSRFVRFVSKRVFSLILRTNMFLKIKLLWFLCAVENAQIFIHFFKKCICMPQLCI